MASVHRRGLVCRAARRTVGRSQWPNVVASIGAGILGGLFSRWLTTPGGVLRAAKQKIVPLGRSGEGTTHTDGLAN
jgi:hypothetical protein